MSLRDKYANCTDEGSLSDVMEWEYLRVAEGTDDCQHLTKMIILVVFVFMSTFPFIKLKVNVQNCQGKLK